MDFINYLYALKLFSVVVNRFYHINIVYDIVATVIIYKIVRINIKLLLVLI